MNAKKFFQFLSGLFLRSNKRDPKAEALARKIRLNALSARLTTEIRRQEGFAKDYLAQAVDAKRTGDDATLGHLRRLLGSTSAIRRRAERMLHVVRMVSTHSEQIECYKDFCEMFASTSEALGQDLSPETVIQAQENLQKSIAVWNSNDAMVDQMLAAFDATLSTATADAQPADPQRDAAIDAVISDLASKRDSSVETKLKDLLQKL